MPEVLTEVDPQPAQASNADLCRAVQAHYDKVSTAAHEWHSAIPKAIDAYYADPDRVRLEREVLRCAKLFTAIKDGEINATWTDRVALSANDLDDAVRKLIEFESSQQQIKK